MATSIPNDNAVADMRRAGVEALEPYPGLAREPWKCRHLKCGNVIYPNRNNVKSGQGPCIWCAPNAPKNPAVAEAKMRERGFRVLTQFPGTGKPWLSRCLAVGHTVAPRYDNTVGRSGRCRFCVRRGPGDPEEAVADMLRVGFRPLEPFKNIATGWLALCLRCGQTSSPRLNNVRSRGFSCGHCSHYGLNPGAPARLYVLEDPQRGATKIGITDKYTRGDRVELFRSFGWELFDERAFETGADAYKVEQRVIRGLRAMGHSPFLTDADMPIGGWTETFDGAQIPAALLWKLASEA